MRILTSSPNSLQGLVKVVEAEENSPQHIFFCIPIDSYEAKKIQNISDLRQFFRKGLVTKIKSNEKVETISLQLTRKSLFETLTGKDEVPKFIANVGGQKIDFHLSVLNFDDYSFYNRLSINFFYEGNEEKELFNKRFIILEPDCKALDKIFIENKIIFTDWNE